MFWPARLANSVHWTEETRKAEWGEESQLFARQGHLKAFNMC